MNLSGTTGKVDLANIGTTSGLCKGGSTCSCSPTQLAQMIDLVGFGTANLFEGALQHLPHPPPMPFSVVPLAVLKRTITVPISLPPLPRHVTALPPRTLAARSCRPYRSTMLPLPKGILALPHSLSRVSLSAAAPTGGVTFDIATADNSATVADNDYVTRSLTSQTIAAGNDTYTFDVTVNGDTTVETNETFYVNVTNVTGATCA